MRNLNYDFGNYPFSVGLNERVAKDCGIVVKTEPADLGIWEERQCDVDTDMVSSINFCPIHSEKIAEVTYTWNNKASTRTEIFYRTPRTLVAYNEGKYCTTGVCLDCLKDYLG